MRGSGVCCISSAMIRWPSRGATAHGHPVVEPFDLASLLVGNAGAGIQPQAPCGLIHQEVKERLAIQVGHHLAAKLIDQSLGVIGRQEPSRRVGKKLELSFAPAQGLLVRLALGYIHGDGNAAENAALGIADRSAGSFRKPAPATGQNDLQFHGGDDSVLRYGALKGQIGIPDFTPVAEETHLATWCRGVRGGGGQVVRRADFKLGQDSGVAGNALTGGVVGEADADRYRLHQRLQALVDLAQGILRLLFPGHVLDHRQETDESAVLVVQRRIGPFAQDGAAVFGEVFVDALGPHVPFGQATEDAVHVRPDGFRHDHIGVLTDQFAGGVAENSFGGLVELKEAIFLVVKDAANGHSLDLEAQTSFIFTQRLLGHALFLSRGKCLPAVGVKLPGTRQSQGAGQKHTEQNRKHRLR